MTKIYLIRHGQSQTNLSKSFTGQLNIALTEEGYQQAERVREFFNEINIDRIYSSDLDRAYNTVLPLSKSKNLTIKRVKEFNEIYAGLWENMRFDDVISLYPDDYNIWLNDISNAKCTGGESVKELAKRVYDKFLNIVNENQNKTIVICLHGTPIRALITLLNGSTLSDMKNIKWVPNASITEITYDDRFIITDATNTDHLDGLLTNLPVNV